MPRVVYMLVQYNLIIEVQFLLQLTVVFLGIQVSLYFINEYRRIKDDKLPQNRFLLSYGLFLLCAIIAALILTINRFFVSDPALKTLVFRIGYVPILLAVIIFPSFIAIPEFSHIIRPKIMKFFVVINFIPLIINFIVKDHQSVIFRASLIPSLLSIVLAFVFQIKLIIRSFGDIKKRLTRMFIAEVFCIIGMLSAADIVGGILSSMLPGYFLDLLIIFGAVFLTVGFFFSFTAVYNFPENAFYEVEWKNTLLKLFIINEKKNECLYNCNFKELYGLKGQNDGEGDGASSPGDDLFSGGLIGIDALISEITRTKGEMINRIDRGNSYIFLERGSQKMETILYALVVKEKLESLQYFLESVKDQFESFYKELLVRLDDIKGSRNQLFDSFDIILKQIT